MAKGNNISAMEKHYLSLKTILFKVRERKTILLNVFPLSYNLCTISYPVITFSVSRCGYYERVSEHS